MTPAQVIALLDDPETLLRRCFVTIMGGVGNVGANGAAPLRTFRVDIDNDNTRRGFTTGLSGLVGRQKDRPNVTIALQPGAAQVPPPPGHVNAYYIPMVSVDDVVAGTSHYTLPTGGATPLCLTSKLDGCVFSLGSDGNGSVLASHVRPSGAGGIADRQDRAKIAGRAGFGGDLQQVRHGKDYDLNSEKVTLIGRLSGNRWKFYMQRQAWTNGAFEVRSAAKVVTAG
jgi:hypothetical protein